MFTSIIKFLNQPYPEHSGVNDILKSSFYAGLIVFLFLAIFQPFDLDSTGPHAKKYAFYFGIITFLSCLIYELIISYILKIERNKPSWTFWKWFVLVIIMILFIAIANYIFVIFIFSRQFNFYEFYLMLQSTIAVGIFPTFILGSITINRRNKINNDIASKIEYDHLKSVKEKLVSLPIKNSNKTLDLNVSKIIYLESMQNYVMVYFLDENDLIIKEIHRNTLTAIEAILQDYNIKRCHRSFLVNSSMIKEISGNAQGLKLIMKYGENIVPVSRKFIHHFRNKEIDS